MEQQVLDCVDKTRQQLQTLEKLGGLGWKRFYGDVCVRIVASFIQKTLTECYKVSEPNVYILGFPNEFDLLILRNNAEKIEYCNAYKPEDVKCGIEVKAHGIVSKKVDIEETVLKIKNVFTTVNNEYPHINFVYFTLQEVIAPKRKNSIDYFDQTQKYLYPYKAFCIRNSRRPNDVQQGMWSKFIKEIET